MTSYEKETNYEPIQHQVMLFFLVFLFKMNSKGREEDEKR